MTPAISVCIPVYGTERSLPACLQSVATQRGLEACGGRNVASLEIIVVDDASPAADPELSSPARIVSQFQQESPWPVVYLEHQENRGILEARRSAGNRFAPPPQFSRCCSIRAGQQRIILRLNDYPYVVPFVIDDEGNWFLKTAYPDRKLKGRV